MRSVAGARVLVIEDDPSILLGLRLNLESDGYRVTTASDGDSGLDLVRAEAWDLVILDLMLPGINGFEVVYTMRAERNRTPVLILSARSADVDKIMGLDLGADDYVTKPFSVGELLARVRAAIRRGEEDQRSTWSFGEVVVDPEAREVRRGAAVVELTATEFDVLATLMRADGRALSRSQIMDAVWGPNHFGTPRTVDNFIAQLRAKLERDPAAPRHILTVRGIGYRFVR